LRANQQAVGPIAQTGTAVYRYDYSGEGLTGQQVSAQDLATGAYVDELDAGVLRSGDGFDGRTPWMRDVSGANTPQEGGDRVRVAVSAAYRNANLWWRTDRAGAHIEDLGRESLEGTLADHLAVQPRDGVRFEAWFDARTHLLQQIAEPRLFFKTRTLFADYAREGGVMVPHRLLIDSARVSPGMST
jgi:hypothetical protein